MQAFRLPLAARVRTHGFTIVELVVMIAIIAFVTLLIVPGILHGREAARKTQYKNNLQSLCLALDMQWSSNIKSSIVGAIGSGRVTTRKVRAALDGAVGSALAAVRRFNKAIATTGIVRIDDGDGSSAGSPK